MAIDYKEAEKVLLTDIKKKYQISEYGILTNKIEALRSIYMNEGKVDKALEYNYMLRQRLNYWLTAGAGDKDNVLKQYERFWRTFLFAAPYRFNDFLVYMERNRDASKRFYGPRKKQLGPIVKRLQAMEDGHLDVLGISLPPGVGKTTLGIFFISWMCGKYPDSPEVATAYGDKLTRSFYDGVLELITSSEYTYGEIFPDSPLIATNSNNETIDLKSNHRFKTLTCRSIDGALTGGTRAEKLLYADDMVQGSEEAFNRERMDKLWTTFRNDLLSRKKENCKVLIIGTRWSLYDPIGRMEEFYSKDNRAKFIKIPALNKEDESNFEYKFDVGFSTKFYKKQRSIMDEDSWRALYQQEPVEREGVLYREDDFMYYNGELPPERPDAVVCACDSKALGRDYVSAPLGYVYGELVYVKDWVFTNALPDVAKPLLANMCIQNNVSRLDVELNNGGNFFAEDVGQLIKDGGGYTSVRIFPSTGNKVTRIVTESDYIKKHFVFLAPKYRSRMYEDAMRNTFTFTVNGKVKHDDAPDSLSMLSTLVKGLSGAIVKVINRRDIPL